MTSVVDYQQMMKVKDDRIADLEKIVATQRERIEELLGKLDKYQSVFNDPIIGKTQSGSGNGGVLKVASGESRKRAIGISAESGGGALNDATDGRRSTKSQSEIAAKDLFKPHKKSESSRALIERAVQDNDFLRNLSSSYVKEIVDLMVPIEYTTGSWIIKEGEVGSTMFVLEDGSVEVSKDGKPLRKLGSGSLFGELAILYNCTRTASIRAASQCKLWAIERQIYHGIMVRMEVNRRTKCVELLKRVPKFSNWTEEILNQFADIFEEIHFEDGQYIARQMAKGDTFYILSSGKIQETKKQPDSDKDVLVRNLVPGDYFGEKALDEEEVRSSNFIASSRGGVDCLVLDRETYSHLIQKIDDVRRSSTEVIRKSSRISKTKADNMTKADLVVVATLGLGGFSRVELVQMKGDTSRTYALKVLKKHHIKKTRQEEHVMNEKNVLSEIRSDFIVRLYRTFKDNKCLYMLMEVCLGGEVWTLLRNKNYFDDSAARFYIGCTVEALAYLHSRGIVYRDLKPENMLLDNLGYMKLVDFGFAKKIGHGHKTWTFCGTPEYVAPEIILNKGHDMSADLWSLGILIFELLTGRPPFSGTDQMQTYNSVLRGIEAVEFPRLVTKNAKFLIKKLCREQPPERLGFGKNGVKDIQRNKWFDGFDWEGLRQRKLEAPHDIKVKNAIDLSNFDKFPADTDANLPDDNTGWDRDF